MSARTDGKRWLGEELARLERAGLRRRRRTVTPLADGTCEINGRRLINFASNDYLGLAGDRRLRDAALEAIDERGVGAGASALISGRTVWHERLDGELASFDGAEAALLFPTGYAANLGTIAAIAGKEDVIVSDRLNHASLIDGCRLSGATVCVTAHRDIEHVKRELRERCESRRRFLVTDGVFSMDGDIAPLPELLNLAEAYDAMLIVDEAHGTGVLGERGRGACELLAVESPRLVRIGTMSKALGCLGGFVVGSHEIIEFLWNRARTQVFSTAMPPALCAAAVAALEIIRDEPQRRDHLRELSLRLRASLSDAGLQVPCEDVTPIIPVVIGDAARTVQLSERLADRGMFVPAIRPPTVPKGTSRLRISLSAEHSQAAVDALCEVLLTELRSR